MTAAAPTRSPSRRRTSRVTPPRQSTTVPNTSKTSAPTSMAASVVQAVSSRRLRRGPCGERIRVQTGVAGPARDRDTAAAASHAPGMTHSPQPVPVTAAEWDERYTGSPQIWSGNPNGALVAEVAALAPGRALDVGCGEGADAVWLATRGWRVTALDVSEVALDRAAQHARAAGVAVAWLHAG